VSSLVRRVADAVLLRPTPSAYRFSGLLERADHPLESLAVQPNWLNLNERTEAAVNAFARHYSLEQYMYGYGCGGIPATMQLPSLPKFYSQRVLHISGWFEFGSAYAYAALREITLDEQFWGDATLDAKQQLQKQGYPSSPFQVMDVTAIVEAKNIFRHKKLLTKATAFVHTAPSLFFSSLYGVQPEWHATPQTTAFSAQNFYDHADGIWQ
jgi:hypothetical protein